MGYYDKKYNISDLVKFTSNGIEKLSFYQIKETLIEMYRNIYGHDIDVDSTTADGQFIYNIALIMENTFNALLGLSNNLSPSMASGKWLDVICSYNGIERKLESKSKAKCRLKCFRNWTPDKENGSFEITLIDTSNNLWRYVEITKSDGTFTNSTFIANEIYEFEFVCDSYGPIDATPSSVSTTSAFPDKDKDRGDINRVLSTSLNPFEVWQISCEVGSWSESDVQLRNRRLLELGYKGNTTLGSLYAGLYNLGVDDVFIYNNSSDTNMIARDGTNILNHNIYVVLRYGNEINSSEIGQLIYNKLTPGVGTTEYIGTDANKGLSKTSTVKLFSILEQSVYWKRATFKSPTFKINFLYSNTYDNDKQEYNIKRGLIEYARSVSLNEDLYISNLITSVNDLSTKISNNMVSYVMLNGEFTSPETTEVMTNNSDFNSYVIKNKDNYFNYDDSSNFKFAYENTYTIFNDANWSDDSTIVITSLQKTINDTKYYITLNYNYDGDGASHSREISKSQYDSIPRDNLYTSNSSPISIQAVVNSNGNHDITFSYWSYLPNDEPFNGYLNAIVEVK